MYFYLFVLLISLTTTLCNVILKKFQQEKALNFPNFCLLNFVNAFTASIFFFVATGFRINMNAPTFMFSLIHAVVVALNILINLCAMSKISLAVIGILTTSGNILGTSAFGVLFLNESISLKLAFAIVLVLVAVILPFVAEREKEQQKNRGGKIAVLFSIILFFMGGVEVTISKLYVMSENVCDTNSYLFMLNFILVIACVIMLIVCSVKTKTGIVKIFTDFSLRHTAYIASRTLISNIGAVFMMLALAMMNASLYSTLTASMALVGNALASVLYFKESVSRASKISVVLAIFAVILAN